MISFDIPSKILHLKRKELSDARVVSFTKKDIVYGTFFVNIYRVFKVNI